MSRHAAATRSHQRSAERRRKKVLLLFGESENDRGAVKELDEGLRPELRGHLQERRKPLMLVKKVTPDELRARKRSLAQQVMIERKRFDVRGVLIHEDCDEVEPAHERVARRYEESFAGADPPVYPILPAWELESWWLLWPDALAA